jgi:hypothetical protein
MSLRGWEFDELEEKSTAIKNQFPILLEPKVVYFYLPEI